MKIIKRGEIIKQVWKVTCYKCKSELEYEASDIRTDGRNESYITCPVCNSYIDSSLGIREEKGRYNDGR